MPFVKFDVKEEIARQCAASEEFKRIHDASEEYFQSEKWLKFKVAKAICDIMLRGYTGFKGRTTNDEEESE